MTPELYPELFEYSAFPVFTLSFSGVIRYKNAAANKYLPMLRKNACVKKYFYPSAIPKEGGILRIAGDTPYRIALALKDEDGLVAVCFSRFQYADGLQTANRLLCHFGNTADSFFAAFAAFSNETEQACAPYTERIYTDILAVGEDKKDFSDVRYSFFETVSLLFEKINTSFGALGYRICAEIADGFLSQKEVRIRLHDFLFFFGRLLYIQMRLSQNGAVSVLLTSDQREHIFRFRIRTKRLTYPLQAEDIDAVVCRAVPECAFEFSLLQKAGLVCTDRLRFSLDPFGCLTAEYRIPYLESNAFFIKSGTFSPLFLAEEIERFIGKLEERLKDNGASC